MLIKRRFNSGNFMWLGSNSWISHCVSKHEFILQDYKVWSGFKLDLHEWTVRNAIRYKSPGTDQSHAMLMQPGCRTFYSEIYKLTNSIRNEEELPEHWKQSVVIVPIYRNGDKTDCIKPLTPELNPSANRCLTRFFTGDLLLEPYISLIYAWKTNKCNKYSFSLLTMYSSSHMFRHYIVF
jgi:hypothetical protein